jgi:hypothetical protein
MDFTGVSHAWRTVAEAMTFLEKEGELPSDTNTIRGNEADARFSNRTNEWRVVWHFGQEDKD